MENPSAIASALLNVARANEHDDPIGALDAFEQVIALGQAGAMQVIVGPALVGVARLRSRMQDPRRALEALDAALSHSDHVGYRPLVVEVLGPSAEILLRVGQLQLGIVLAGGLLEGALPAINVSSQRNADLQDAMVAARDTRRRAVPAPFARGAAMSYEEVPSSPTTHQALETTTPTHAPSWRSQTWFKMLVRSSALGWASQPRPTQ
jgi:hypothetical protein